MAANPLLSISDVVVEYNLANNPVTALDGLTLEIPSEGYTLGIVGESGSGKTTLGMSIMNNIEMPGRIVRGKVEYNGNDVLRMSKQELKRYRWKEVSMVYQSAMNSLNPVKKISNPIIEVLRSHLHCSKQEASERALKLLSNVGFNIQRAYDYPYEMSGGMKQRVVIALALALSPKLLIADEPASALDVVSQRQILRLLKSEVVQNGLSMIFITHDISSLPGLVQNVAVMHAGEIVELGPLDRILSEPFHPYTQMLLATLLTLDSDIEAIPSFYGGGSVGNSLVPGSCKYSNECRYVFGRCITERPELRQVEKGRWVRCHKY
jgi:oligopeptide/dipeptide ABC transporter ATP-binding protein